MKKIFSLWVALSFLSTAFAATTFVFASPDALNQSADGFSVVLDKGAGNNPPAYYESNGMRLYANNTITVSGENITAIQIVFAKQGTKAYASLDASEGNLVSGGESTAAENAVIDSWTGNSSSVTFTLGASGQRLIKQLVVNGEAVVDQPVDTTGTEQPETLDPNYNYSEPTEVRVPDFTVQGKEYTFIQNNIEVKASKGAITENYFSAHAENTLTFTAAKPIKGLTVKGFVKKNFEAVSDHGEISYISPADEDATGDPVLVITDIDAASVTITCAKQLRCYSVLFYFDKNPVDSVEGGVSGTGETLAFDYNTADIVYESEYSEEGSFYNYTVYLYNEEDEVTYLGLDLYTMEKDRLAGTFSFAEYTLGEYSFYQFGPGENDYSLATDGEVAITVNGDQCTIAGYITCANKNTYNFSYTGDFYIYTDEEYYGGEDSQAVETVPALNTNAAMYDILGRPVGNGYKGIVIQNGNKYMVR